MNWTSLLLFLHIVASMAWLGGSLFIVTRFGPAMRGAQSAAVPVQVSLLQQGGISRYFIPVALLTVIPGVVLFIQGDWYANDSAQGLFMKGGAAAGVVAFVLGAARSGPLEAKMQAIVKESDGAPNAEQGRDLGALAAQAGQTSRLILAFLILATIGMLGRLFV